MFTHAKTIPLNHHVLETSGSVCAETLLRACVSHIFPVLGTFLM